jgi:hypothetical protein
VITRIQKDPRWTQEWYLRHHEVWWPGGRHGHWQLKPLNNVRRDWSETLGNTYGRYSVSAVSQAGTTVTVTTASANGFTSGQLIAVLGVGVGTGGCTAPAVDAIIEGKTITVSGATTFTFTSSVSATFGPTACGLLNAIATGPLPATTFEPVFDFSLNMPSLAGFGTVNTLDLLAENQTSGQYLATAGALTVATAPGYLPFDEAVGNYQLIPGGPLTTVDPNDAFVLDNVLFPSYPDTSPPIDANGGISFIDSSDDEMSFDYYGGALGAHYWQMGTYAAGDGGGGLPFFSDPGGGQTFPAKYTFDVTAAPSCTGDYVVMGIPANAVVGGQPNIVGYNQLYTGSSPTGICTGTAPNLMFAYASAGGSTPGEVPGSISISTDGSQLAYVEDVFPNSSNSYPISYFHVLTIGTTGTNGIQSSSTSAPVAVAPGAAGGNNAGDDAVQLTAAGCTNQGSTTSPYINYEDNAAYVTTYSWSSTGVGSGCLYKIIDVFGATVPAIQWSVPITSGAPSSPVCDALTGEVFFTDSSGNIDFVTDKGLTASGITSLSVAPGTTSENPVTIDNTNEMVYATFNTNGSDAVVVQAPETLATHVSAPVGLGNTLYSGPYGVDFNNAYYGGTGTPMMFVAGTDMTTGEIPTLYSVEFTPNGSGTPIMDATTASSTPLATGGNGIADSSPVTEFYNTSLSEDFLFVGVTNNCAATDTTTAGCVMSLNISGTDNSTPTFPSVVSGTTAIAASGGSTGIIVDNEANPATNPQASSVYYGTKNAGTLVKATQSDLE